MKSDNLLNMEIVPVSDKRSMSEFISVTKLIYRDDPTWVCPPDNDIRAVFDPSKNVYYQHGRAKQWVLKDSNGLLAGRIAAFIDDNTAMIQDQPTGGIGFFECLNDQESANLLFDTAKKWLITQGMQAMDGPINFGETDSYWGLLVDGFTHPSYEIAYNPPYYQNLFETYGFQTYYKQEGFHLDITKELPPRFLKIAQWVAAKPEYSFRHFTWADQDKFVSDFADVFNVAWASFKENFEPLKKEYIQKTLRKARAVIDPEFIWLAYRHEQPIAIYLMYPDVNQVFKYLNGKLDLINKLRFIWMVKRKKITRARGVLMGVIPKYQNLGIESAIILQLANVFKKKPHYHEIEFSWVGDFNPKMRKIFISVGSVSVKNYITYRYLFDRNAEFKRYPIPEEK